MLLSSHVTLIDGKWPWWGLHRLAHDVLTCGEQTEPVRLDPLAKHWSGPHPGWAPYENFISVSWEIGLRESASWGAILRRSAVYINKSRPEEAAKRLAYPTSKITPAK